MQVLTRARVLARRQPRRLRESEFDRAVHEFFMRIALDEAAKGRGRTHPNPVVGAILVKSGRVIARGHHRRAGSAHAEVVALERAGARAKGADLYTTLEPCDHYGKTPPCSLAILEAGVRRVITASADPNPLVNGRGVERLRKHGVEVITGVLRAEADGLNRPFFKHIRTGMPWVTLKAAITLDGKIATHTGDSRWITGEQSRLEVHRLRDQADAILVGAGTVRQDDPQLTTRLPDGEGRDPVRVVVDSHLRLSPRQRLFTQRSPARTIVATVEPLTAKKARALTDQGVEVWTVKAGRDGRVELKALLRRLAKQGLLHVVAEGGSELYGALLRAKLVDELWLFVAPKLVGAEGLSWTSKLGIGRMAKALELGELTVDRFGRDLLLRTVLTDLSME